MNGFPAPGGSDDTPASPAPGGSEDTLASRSPGGLEAYLAELRRILGAGRAERLLAEVEDHLLEATAAGLLDGLDQAAAERRALALFGAPELVARQYAAELAEAVWEKRMQMLRFVAIGFVLLTLYYARFFIAVRQEAATLVQIGVLLAAAAVLTLPVRFGPPGSRPWFHAWRPVTLQGWATTVFAVGLLAAVFAWADHDAHSASDTLNRAVPTMCLIAAIALRIVHQRGGALALE
jgi:hypothetical protein